MGIGSKQTNKKTNKDTLYGVYMQDPVFGSSKGASNESIK